MRRFVLAASMLALTGCSGMGDLFSAHADVVATADGQSLTAQQLSDMIGKAKGAQANAETAEFIATVWTDYTLFAQAVAHHAVRTDSAAVAEALWPQIAEAKGAVWYDTLSARRGQMSAGLADSAYLADTVRVLQHILVQVEATAPAVDRAAARKKAQLALAQLQQGANFAALASTISDDPGSRANGGWLPPAKKGQYVTAFDSAAWRLAPGQMSGIVETPFGYHIIRRPTMEDSRAQILAFLTQDAARRLDSIYMDSLAITNDVQVSGDAPALMREAAADRSGQRTSRKSLAKFHGGKLTVAEFLRWLSALPPQFAAQVKDASDEQLSQFARALSTKQLLLRQADSAGIALPADQWAAMEASYEAAVDSLKLAMGLGADVTDSSVALSERTRVAQLRVDDYFNQMFANVVRPRPLPGALGQVLREDGEARMNQAGITRAVELAAAAKAAQSAPGAGGAPAGPVGAGGAPPAGAIQPAAGPPPVGGAAPSQP